MKSSLQQKLNNLDERYTEIGQLLSEAGVINDQKKYTALTKEYAQIEPVVHCYQAYKKAKVDLSESEVMLKDPDQTLREMAQEELSSAKKTIEELDDKLNILLLPKDPNDDKNVFLEIRAGTGGDEAAIFSGDLYRMYLRYAESQGWKVELMNESRGEHGGFKEIVAKINGDHVYSKLKFESGAHRVQRVPDTESQGRVHTSACTVAIMPEVDEVEAIDINMQDVRVDTFRASGAGGQHVNKTDSAIRLTHLPSGIVVECQDERSQHKNKARALSLLAAKILDIERSKQHEEQSAQRKSLVGSGDRSERIRTYNYSQGRVSDHRINLTLYKLTNIMEGDLGCVIEPLVQENQADQLASLNDEL